MDVLEFIRNRGQKQIPNPAYNPRSKKNTESPFITVPAITPNYDPFVELNREDLLNQASVSEKELNKYRKYGINWNPREAATGSLDRQLADAQSASSKFFNALSQAVVSETVLGSVKGLSNLIDGIGQVVGASDHDYSNPVSRKLDEWQETFKNEVAPIYTTPGVDITNGGLTDAGWWASNLPSVMSSLSLLLPSTGVVKGLGYLGKTTKVGRAVTSSAKWLTRANKMSSGTRETVKTIAEHGANALLMRTMENYQEARQVYDDMYEHASASLSNMNDEEYNNFLKRNARFLEDIDTSNKDEVAKAISKKSADTTFRNDFANIGFDILQLYALRNVAFKGFRNQPSRASVRRAHLNSIKYDGLNDAEKAAKKASRTFTDKLKERAEDAIYGSGLAIIAQLSEGVEEAVNYVSQQEGMNLGHVMLGEIDDATYRRRFKEYAKAPELWESAFWGVLGGVVFQGLGSGFNRAQNALYAYNENKKYRENNKTKEKIEKPTWSELWQMPEIKRRVANIESRGADLQDYLNKLDMIENQNKDPYETSEDGQARTITTNEKERLKEKAYNDMLTKMTLKALDSGNYDLLKEYLSSDEIKQVIVNSGAVSESDATRYQQEAIQRMTAIEKQYDQNVEVLNNLSKRINTDRKDPIPTEYIQIIARNNIEHQLQIKDWETELNALEIKGNEQKEYFKYYLDSDVKYKAAVRLVFLTNQLSDLEYQRREILNDKELLNSVSGQQELNFINTQINNLKDIIYNLEPQNATANLLFAIQNSTNYEKGADGKKRHNKRNTEYLNFRANIVELENTEDTERIEEIDNYLVSYDRRLHGISKGDLHQAKILEDNIERAYDVTSGLDAVSEDLHKTYFRLADLETAIATERKQIKITKDEVLNEINAIHNFVNAARKKAVEDATATITGLAKTYGTYVIREALYQRYENNVIDNNYFGDDSKAIADTKVFNNALDILNLDSAANKNLLGYIDDLLKIQEAVSAAQGENSFTSEESISEPQTEQVDNTTQEKINANMSQTEQTNSNIPQGQTPSQIAQNTSQNNIIQLKEGDTIYGTATPNPDMDGTFTLDVNPENPIGLAYLNNEGFYTKDGVSLTDSYIISEKPVIKVEKDGTISPVEKGLIVRPTEENIAKEEEKQAAKEEDAAISSPSTGELIAPKPPVIPNTVAPDPVQSTQAIDESVPTDTISDDDALVKEAAAEINKEVSTAILKESTIDWADLKTRLTNKYISVADNKANTERLIDISLRSWQKMYDRILAKKNNEVDDVLIKASSLTEKSRGNKTLLSDFHKAIDTLVEKYIEDVAADKINGKYYVRLEDLLRYCNNATETQTTAYLLFDSFVEYMRSSDKYVITDNNISEAIANANKSVDKRLAELSEKDNLYGINFEGFVSELEELGLNRELERVTNVINALDLGDKIGYQNNGTSIIFKVNNVTIGNLPIPYTGAKGELWQFNDGWKTDILNDNGTIISELKNLFEKWITNTENDASIEELNDIVVEAAFGKLKQTELKKLANRLVNNSAFLSAKRDGFVSDNAEPITLLNGLAKLWGYTRQVNGLTQEETAELRAISVNNWFETKIAPSFEMVKILEASQKGEVTVGKISEGELIITDKKDALPVSKAIGSKHTGTIRLAVSESIGDLVVAGKGINGETTLSFGGIGGSVTRGSTVVVIPTRNGQHGYVHAYPQSITSSQIKPKAKAVVNAILSEIDRISKEGTTQEICDNLERFIRQVLNAKGSTNTPLLRVKGSGVVKAEDNVTKAKLGFTILYYDKNGKQSRLTISSKIPKTNATFVELGYKTNDDSEYSVSTENAIAKLKEVISNNTVFNIAYSYVNSDNNTNLHLDGLAHRDKTNGDFVINIPNQGSFTFDSFNSFILDNDLVSLTTKPAADGTNYNKGTAVGNKLANQVLKVKIEASYQSPVEDNNTDEVVDTKSTVDKVLDILNDNKNRTTVGRRVAKLILGEKVKNIKIGGKVLDLFPQNIKFVNEIIGNIALTNVGSRSRSLENNSNIILEPGQVVIGREWLSLLNGTISDQKQAVRKLVHERLHEVLHTNGNEKYVEQIRDIFNEFVAKNTNESLNQYKFDSTPEQKAEYWTDGKLNTKGLEEFLVETLTSKELAEGLNNIQVEETIDNKSVKKSILQKIMERLADIFGWGITKGSLYEKEFNVLRDFFEDNTDETIDSTTETETQSDVQTESNFDEPITEEKIEKEETITLEQQEDDMEFEDDDSVFASSILETSTSENAKFANTSSLTNKLPLSQQVDLIDKINNGEIQTSCK